MHVAVPPRGAGSNRTSLILAAVLILAPSSRGGSQSRPPLSSADIAEIVALEKTKASAISVYLSDTTPLASAMDFKLHLENDQRVSAVIYFSKDQAMARFRQLPALDPRVIDTLATNPLTAHLDATVRDS